MDDDEGFDGLGVLTAGTVALVTSKAAATVAAATSIFNVLDVVVASVAVVSLLMRLGVVETLLLLPPLATAKLESSVVKVALLISKLKLSLDVLRFFLRGEFLFRCRRPRRETEGDLEFERRLE